jgi:hypothetical protein
MAKPLDELLRELTADRRLPALAPCLSLDEPGLAGA